MKRHKTGLYIHIPFCVKKCNYCAFLSFPAEMPLRRKYAKALMTEISMRAEETMHGFNMPKYVDGEADALELDTVYFGGGTPSIFEVSDLSNMMKLIKSKYRINGSAEITLEANPGTLGSKDPVTRMKFQAYKSMGINRLSMGVQSMDNNRLAFLGRIHTAENVARDFRLAREAGFDNINLDIIFSVPGETTADAIDDARKIIELGPEHISCYSLQLEEGTPFYEMAEAGRIHEIDDEEDRATYHELCKFLAASGYEHYEISNFAREGCKAEHNSLYWSMDDYIGAGLGASGFVNGRRYKNVSDIDEYFRLIDAGILPEDSDETHMNTPFDNISEAVFTGLRRIEGFRYEDALSVYRNAPGVQNPDNNESCNGCGDGTVSPREEFWEIYADAKAEAEEFCREGFLIMDDSGLRLTEAGIDISNTIMSIFV